MDHDDRRDPEFCIGLAVDCSIGAVYAGARKDIFLMEQSQQNQKETIDNAEDNPALSNVIERNIRTIIHLRLKAAHSRGLQDRIADIITSFSGSLPMSTHTWFIALCPAQLWQ